MALDRMNIEKRDFPIGRRGYEPEAVDAHLAVVAVEVEALKRQLDSAASGAAPSAPGAPPVAAAPVSLAAAASEQVRTIVEAAENSAADIERAAQQAAATIRSDAAADAEQTRQDAIERSQEHVTKVSEGTGVMLQRVDAMEAELSALVESLRTGAARLNADLSLLHGNMSELYGAASPHLEPEPEPEAPAWTPEPEAEAPAWSPEPAADVAPETPAWTVEPPADPVAEAAQEAPTWSPEPVVEPEPETPAWTIDPAPAAEAAPETPTWGDTTVSEPVAEPVPEPEAGGSAWGNSAAVADVPPVPEPAAEAAPAAAMPGADVEGARLIALNMALNGQPREETDRYLAENFDLPDRGTLLDEVYSTLEG